jgi:hypothetical protein
MGGPEFRLGKQSFEKYASEIGKPCAGRNSSACFRVMSRCEVSSAVGFSADITVSIRLRWMKYGPRKNARTICAEKFAVYLVRVFIGRFILWLPPGKARKAFAELPNQIAADTELLHMRPIFVERRDVVSASRAPFFEFFQFRCH